MASNSTPRRRKPLKRNRVLRRGRVHFEPVVIDHFPYIWAAYKQGSFENAEEFPPGLSAPDFQDACLAMVEGFLSKDLAEMQMAYAQTPDGVMPVAVITIEYSGKAAYPHAYWFPWATDRNKLETGVRFFVQLKKNNLVLIAVKYNHDMKFFQHLCKYGLLRAVGKIREYYSDGKPAMLFQSVGS